MTAPKPDSVRDTLQKMILDQALANQELENMKAIVEANTRALRGFNGTTGLIANVDILIKRLDELSPKIETIYEFCISEKVARKAEEQGEAKGGKGWKFIFQSILLPVIIYFSAWFLFTILPEIIAHLGVKP